MRKRLLASVLAVSLSGCGMLGSQVVPGNIPAQGSLIPAKTLAIGPSIAWGLEDLVLTALVVGALYYMYDPLAPNWEISETPVGNDVYQLSFRMKRFTTGGDGEVLQIMKRRGEQLVQARQAEDYQIVELAQGIESSTPVARRYAEGRIRVLGARLPMVDPSKPTPVVRPAVPAVIPAPAGTPPAVGTPPGNAPGAGAPPAAPPGAPAGGFNW